MIDFELWAECRDADGAGRLAGHFSGLKHSLRSDRTITWSAAVVTPFSQGRGVLVSSPDLGRWGVRTVADAVAFTEAGLRLLHHLLAAPDFRYAHLGWEATNHPMSDLPEYITDWSDGTRNLEVECIVDDALWSTLGEPNFMPPFRPGYRWKPYRGERYYPLDSHDHPELTRLRRELLPPA